MPWLALALGLLAGAAFGASAAEPGARARPPRIDAIFAIDNSGSMKSTDPGFATRQLVERFAAGLERGSRLGLVLFDQEARLTLPLTRMVGAESAERLAAALASIDYRGQLTHSPAGIERALYELKANGRPDADKVVVFITDGIVDTGDRQRDLEKKRWLIESVAPEGRQAGVRIFGVAFGEAADVELIQALALRTEAGYFRVSQASDVSEVLAQIGRAIESRPAAGPATESHVVATAPARPAPAPNAPPGVSSAPPSRTPGLVLLSLGVLLGCIVLAVPAVQRRQRMRRQRPANLTRSVGVSAPPQLALPPRQGSSQPVARLVDVSNVSRNGLLPFALEQPTTSIGRDPGNDVVIPRETVSSFQATIDYHDGYFYLEDHRSTNGTFLNGRALTANVAVQMKSGDRIDFANFEFRFIIPDHEPRGKTVVLEGSQLRRSVPPAVGDAPAAPAEDAAATHPDGPTSYPGAFDQCLALHLNKIGALSEQHRAFVQRAFPGELTELLSQRAEELIGRCQADAAGQSLDLVKGGIHYTLCVLPNEISDAAAWFTAEHGGYARYLASLLESWTSTGRECRAICAITFGMIEEAWISITIVPVKNDADAVEIMSFEFLSEEERRRALSLDIMDVGRSD